VGRRRRPPRSPQHLGRCRRGRGQRGNEDAFRTGLVALLDAVRTQGTPLEDDSLEPSELILPMSDATLVEVRGLLTDEGLVPDR